MTLYTDNVPRFSIRQLYQAGVLPAVVEGAGSIAWPGLAIRWHLKPVSATEATLDLAIAVPGQPEARQRLKLENIGARYRRGPGWMFAATDGPRWCLFCDPARTPLEFLSSDVLGVRYACYRPTMTRRPLERLAWLRKRLELVDPGSKRAQRLELQIAETELRCLTQAAENLNKRNKKSGQK